MVIAISANVCPVTGGALTGIGAPSAWPGQIGGMADRVRVRRSMTTRGSGSATVFDGMPARTGERAATEDRKRHGGSIPVEQRITSQARIVHGSHMDQLRWVVLVVLVRAVHTLSQAWPRPRSRATTLAT
jgi:hypothetical protein